VPPLGSMNIPQENKIFLNIPSYDKIAYSHLLKSPPLIEANGSPVVFPHCKPNAPKARMGMVQSQVTLQVTLASYQVLEFIALWQNGGPGVLP
jgi:hypothetical protein